jgi:pyruvate ferredoxin oxidoreductase alpha subunit
MTHDALIRSKQKIEGAAREFEEIYGNYYGGLLEEIYTEDAEIILIAMGTMVGTIKVALQQLRNSGKKIGLVKARSFRPFPDSELRTALGAAQLVVVLDRSFSASFGGILGGEVKSCLYGTRGPAIINFVVGLGSREIYPETVFDIVNEVLPLVSLRKGQEAPL